MVSADGVTYFGFFLVFFSKFHTQQCMRQFGFFIGHLADIMKQTGTTGFLRIEAELRSHDCTKIGCFA